MSSLLYAFVGLNIFINCLILHELGHWLFFKVFKKKEVELRIRREDTGFVILVGYPLDYKDLSKSELITSYLSGVILGLIPLLIALLVNVMFLILIPAYLVCCIPDIKNSWRVLKHD